MSEPDDFEDYDHSAAPIIWDGLPPPAEIETLVRADIKADLVDLACPGDLMFHTVFVSDGGMHGPYVMLFAHPTDSKSFIGVYDPSPAPNGVGGRA